MGELNFNRGEGSSPFTKDEVRNAAKVVREFCSNNEDNPACFNAGHTAEGLVDELEKAEEPAPSDAAAPAQPE